MLLIKLFWVIRCTRHAHDRTSVNIFDLILSNLIKIFAWADTMISESSQYRVLLAKYQFDSDNVQATKFYAELKSSSSSL